LTDHKINIELKALDHLSDPLKKMASLTRSLGQSFAKSTPQLDEFSKRQENLKNRLRDLSQATLASRRSWKEAESGIKSLSRELKLAETPSKKLREEFDRSKDSARKLKDEYEKKIGKIRILKKEIGSLSLVEQKAQNQRKPKGTGSQVEALLAAPLLASLGQRLSGSAMLPTTKAAEIQKEMGRVLARVIDPAGLVGPMRDAALKTLENSAFSVGRDVGFKGVEVAKAITTLGTGGLGLKDMTPQNLKAVLGMAKLSDVSPDASGELLSSVANAYQKNFSELPEIADKIQKLADISAVKFEDIRQSLVDSMPVAKQAGVPLESLLSMIGTMGDVGVKGSVAGTSIKNSILELVKAESLGGAPKTEEAKILRGLGIKVVDQNKKMRPFFDIMEDIFRSFEKNSLTEFQRQKIVESLFGKEGLAGISSLFGAMSQAAKGSQDAGRKLDDLRQKEVRIKDSEGSVLRKLAVENATYNGSLERLSSSFDQLLTVMGKPLLASFSDFYNKLSDIMQKITSLLSGFNEKNPDTAKFLAGAGTGAGLLGGVAALGAAFKPVRGVMGRGVGALGRGLVSVGSIGVRAGAAALPAVGAAIAGLSAPALLAGGAVLGAGGLAYYNRDKIASWMPQRVPPSGPSQGGYRSVQPQIIINATTNSSASDIARHVREGYWQLMREMERSEKMRSGGNLFDSPSFHR
jgi:TP901 family phage tail tape measure protein